MANDSVACLTCTKLVPEDSQAVQCDLCHRWAHIGCVGVTKAAYPVFPVFSREWVINTGGCCRIITVLHSYNLYTSELNGLEDSSSTIEAKQNFTSQVAVDSNLLNHILQFI